MGNKKIKSTTNFFVNKSIAATIILILLISFCSASYNKRAKQLNQGECFSTLTSSSADAAHIIEANLNGGLNSMHIIARQFSQTGLDNLKLVKAILGSFATNSISHHIGILLSDNTVLTPEGTVIDANGILNFSDEVADTEHISCASPSVYDHDKLMLHGFVPIVIDGETVGLFFDEVDPEAAAKAWSPEMYDDQARFCIIDRTNGSIMINDNDAISQNINEIGNEHLISEVMNGKSGYMGLPIKGELTFACYMPLDTTGEWEIIFFVSAEKTLEASNVMRKNFYVFLIEEGFVFLMFMAWIFLFNKHSIKKTEESANFDALTGLQNRNMFEKFCRSKKDNSGDLACIYIDVNGLHEVNNTQGHSAGDRMLKTISDTLRNAFADAEIFRIGGDEFVIFQDNGSGTGINLKIRSVKEQLKTNNYHISAGISFSNGNTHINDIVKDAEKKMFDNKKIYYEKLGLQARNTIHTPTEIDDDESN